MAYFPTTSDLIQARFVAYTPSQISMNVLHLRRTNPIPVGTGASLQELANTLDGIFAPKYKALMSADAKWRGVGCSVIYPIKTVEYPAVANDGAGTIVADMLPTQTTYVIQKRTVLGGRSNRGRLYPGFPPITAVDPGGEMAAAYAATVDLLALGYDGLLPTFSVTGSTGDTDFTFVLKHSSGFSFIDIDSFAAEHKFATQRRRGQYGRQNVLPF